MPCKIRATECKRELFFVRYCIFQARNTLLKNFYHMSEDKEYHISVLLLMLGVLEMAFVPYYPLLLAG